jgi:hypothetical protein
MYAVRRGRDVRFTADLCGRKPWKKKARPAAMERRVVFHAAQHHVASHGALVVLRVAELAAPLRPRLHLRAHVLQVASLS